MRIQTYPKQGSIVSKIGRRIQKTYPKFARIQKTYPKLHQRIQKKCVSKILDTNQLNHVKVHVIVSKIDHRIQNWHPYPKRVSKTRIQK